MQYTIRNHSSDLTVLSKLGDVGRSIAHAMFCTNRRQKEYALSLFDTSEQGNIAPKITVLPMGVSLDDDHGRAGASA